MAEYKNNTNSIVFWYVNQNTYGHLEPNQVLATNKEFQILNTIEELNAIISEPYEYEIPEVIEPEKPTIDYDAEVNKLVRQNYTASQEFAIQRKYLLDKSTEEEFLEYYDYCEDCKRQVKEMMNNPL